MDQSVWVNPKSFCLTMRCTKMVYAENFVNSGEIKFSLPKSWIEYGEKNGDGRGDVTEGAIAYYHMYDIQHVLEIGSKCFKDKNIFPYRVGERIYLKRRTTMQLPCFCFYILKFENFTIPKAEGKQRLRAIVKEQYFKDFCDSNSLLKHDNSFGEDNALILIYDFDEFKNRLIIYLEGLGVKKEEIIIGYISYVDYNKYGENGYVQYEDNPPKELLRKNIIFSHQSEARIIINTTNKEILEKLKNPIQIGNLSDISECKSINNVSELIIEATFDIKLV